jgi:hypothetical protein
LIGNRARQPVFEVTDYYLQGYFGCSLCQTGLLHYKLDQFIHVASSIIEWMAKKLNQLFDSCVLDNENSYDSLHNRLCLEIEAPIPTRVTTPTRTGTRHVASITPQAVARFFSLTNSLLIQSISIAPKIGE